MHPVHIYICDVYILFDNVTLTNTYTAARTTTACTLLGEISVNWSRVRDMGVLELTPAKPRARLL